MSAAEDQAARRVLLSQWQRFKGPAPSPTQLQTVQAIAHLEGGPTYGGDRHNWGGIQCTGPRGEGGACPEGCFGSTDTHADGTPYAACFRAYDSPELGAYDLLRLLFAKGLRAALGSGDAEQVAYAMHAQKYFELAPGEYAKRIAGRAPIIAKSLGEPVFLRIGGGASSTRGELVPLAAVSVMLYLAYRNRRRWRIAL